MPEEHNLWIAVCTDLHGSRGPYETLEQATEACVIMTKRSACKFQPVPFVFEGDIELLDADEGDGYSGGQYL